VNFPDKFFSFLFRIPLYLCFLAFLFLIITCTNKKELSREEAIDCLKILNSDLVNLFDATSEKQEIIAMDFLLHEPSAPIPFKNDPSASFLKYKAYSFDENKGIYAWDEGLEAFVKMKDTTVVLIKFKKEPGMKDAIFILSRYDSRKTNSRPDFPVEIAAELRQNGKKMFEISHKAELDENFPKFIKSKATGGNYYIEFNMERTGRIKELNGRVKLKFRLNVGHRDIILSEIDTEIEYHKTNYSVSKISTNNHVFGTYLKGNIDYSRISPTSNDYTNEVNRNSSLILYRKKDSAIIGELVIGEYPKADQRDYFIQFSDGSKELLGNHILLLKKVLNLKY